MEGIAIGHNSVFDTRISNICKTTRSKVQNLNRIKNTLDKIAT